MKLKITIVFLILVAADSLLTLKIAQADKNPESKLLKIAQKSL